MPKQWTEEEDQFLADNVMRMSNKEMAESLGVTSASVANRMKRKGIRRAEKPSEWTDQEVDFLIKNVSRLTQQEIADHLGKTKRAVTSAVRRRGLQTDGNKGAAIKFDRQNREEREVHRGKVPEGWFSYPGSQRIAKEEGLQFYFNGKACKNNHIELRYANSGQCRGCKREDVRRRQGTPELLAWRKRFRQQQEQRDKGAIYVKARYAADPEFAMRRNLSSRIAHSLRENNARKPEETLALLDCTWDEFVEWISSQFEEGMTLDNYGEWHLDHVRPLESFQLSENGQPSEQCYVGFNWRNYQPLWAAKNISKSDNYEPADEVEWAYMMRELGYDGELFLLFEEGRGGLYGQGAAGEVDT